MEKKEILEQLLGNGAEMIKNLSVKNVNTKRDDNGYVRVTFTLDKNIPAMTEDKDHKVVKGEMKIFSTSLFAVGAVLRDNDNASFAVNYIVEHPESLTVLLNGAKIDIVQEFVKAKAEYTNPWASNGKAVVFDRDTIITSVVNIKLSDFGVSKLDKIADKLLGF